MKEQLLIENPYFQALVAVVAELAEMGVDLDEVERRAVEGLRTGRLYAFRGKRRAHAGAEVLAETICSCRYILADQ